MRTLIFIQNLKKTLLEIKKNGGDNIFFVQPDYTLIQKLKAFSIKRIQESKSDNVEHVSSIRFFKNDLLSRDIFISRVRYCMVKLREFNINKKKYFDYISEAIYLIINNKNIFDFNNYEYKKDSWLDFEESLIKEIAKCFLPWYRPEDIFLIDFSQDHQLVYVDYLKKKWFISNLGTYFSQLPPFEATAFLCALEVVLTLEHHQNNFISKNLLNELISGKKRSHGYRNNFPYTLTLLGIAQRNYTENSISITDFGQRVISYVTEKFEEYREAILFMIESEATGFRYPAEINFSDFQNFIKNSSILITDQKESINNAIKLYRSGDFIDSLRIMYPLIEGTMDLSLQVSKVDISNLNGMRAKIKKLEEKSLISSKLTSGLEIFNSRNKVLYGNILENDPELARPLFSLVLAYLKSLVSELDRLH